MRTSRLVLGEEAADGGLHAKNLEEVADDFEACCRFGLTAADEAQIVGGGEGHVSGHISVDAALLAEFFVSVSRVSGARESAVSRRRGNPHELPRIGERQGPQKQRVDYAEDADVGSDGKSQNEDRNYREATITAQRPDGVFQVLQENIKFHRRLASRFRRSLCDAWNSPSRGWRGMAGC